MSDSIRRKSRGSLFSMMANNASDPRIVLAIDYGTTFTGGLMTALIKISFVVI